MLTPLIRVLATAVMLSAIAALALAGEPQVRQPVRCWLASALLFARVQRRLGLPDIQ
jgi:hypothetical protein